MIRPERASLWPGIADVDTIRVRGTAPQAHLLAGWLRSRLGHEITLDHVEAERLEGDRFTRDPVYEAAVRATAG